MVYLTFGTAAGHALAVNPRKQRSLFWSIQDGQIAEARLSEKRLSYRNYRKKRVGSEPVEFSISIAQSVKRQLHRMDESTFAQLDKGILTLARRPTRAGSKPSHYRWFLGDLRRVMVGEFPIVYTVAENGDLTILNIGYRRWTEPVKAPRTPKKDTVSAVRQRERKKQRSISALNATDRFIAYSGETPDELFSYPAEGQSDSLVEAFRQGIQRKAECKGDGALTDEERIVLAVTALEQEVNNGGYDQFFRNESRKFTPIIVASLRRIGCHDEAKITKRALGALQLREPDERAIEAAMSTDDPDRDEELERCDQLFYGTQQGMAERLYAFIKAHRAQMRFP